MLQIDECLKPSECDSNKECSDEAACPTTQQAALVSASTCPSQQAQQAAATCPSQQAAQQVVTLVAAQEPVSACSEVQAQSCKTSECATTASSAPSACATTASAPAACATSECATAECETNTVVTLVEEIVEEECSECCEESVACEEIVVSSNNASGTFEFVVNTGGQAQVIEVCCEEVEEVCCEEATEVGFEVATAECCKEEAEACCDEQEIAFDLTALDSLGYVGSGHGEKAMKVMIQIDGDVDNLDAQIAELLANIDVQQLGGHSVIRLDAADNDEQCSECDDNDDGCEDCDEKCSECDDEHNAPKLIQKRIELRRPVSAQQSIEGQHHLDLRGGLTFSGNAPVVEVVESRDNMEQRLVALENRLARMEQLLERLNERL